MKFVATYLKEYKVQAFLAPLFKMLEALFELLVPLVMASLINQGIGNSDKTHVLRMGGVLILLAVVGLAFSITAQYFSAKAAVYTCGKIRADLFRKIMGLSATKQEQVGVEALTARMTSDINQVQNGINMFLRLFLRSPFIVFGAMIMAFIVDVKSALIFAVIIPFLSLVVYLIMKYTLPKYRMQQKQLEGILHRVGENLEGARVIRAFCREDEERDSFIEKTGELYSLQMKSANAAALLNPITYIVVNVGVVAVIYVASMRVSGGFILKGEVVAQVNYMSQILVELIKLANLIVLLMKAFPSASRIQEVMEMESDERQNLISNENEKSEIAIKLNRVSYAYPGDMEAAVENISLQVKAGSVLGVIGGTGSGKSTLLKLLYRAYDTTSGDVEIFGKNVRAYTDSELSKIFGVTPQKAVLLTGNVKDNLCLKESVANKEEIYASLKTAQAFDFIDEKDGLDTEVLRNGRNFSGGQRQRLTIARALVGRPDIVILDDSASALDLLTESRLKKELAELPWKPTVIIVSQRASSVKSADQILVLDDGKCVGLGTHDELLKTCETYEDIYYCQYPREEAGNE